jgi:hypothetical protein
VLMYRSGEVQLEARAVLLGVEIRVLDWLVMWTLGAALVLGGAVGWEGG